LLPFTLSRIISYEGNKLTHLPLENTEEMERLQEQFNVSQELLVRLNQTSNGLSTAVFGTKIRFNLPSWGVISKMDRNKVLIHKFEKLKIFVMAISTLSSPVSFSEASGAWRNVVKRLVMCLIFMVKDHL